MMIYNRILLLFTLAVLAVYSYFAFKSPFSRNAFARSQSSLCDQNQRNIAYFVQVSSSNIHMLPTLLSVLGTDSDDILLHFDAAIDDTLLSQYHPSSTRIRLLEPRQHLTWGKISLVLNTRRAMHHMLTCCQCWTHFIAMSPSAYPLLAGIEFHRILHSRRFLSASFGQFRFNRTLNQWKNCPVEESLSVDQSSTVKGEAWFIWSRNVSEFLSGVGRNEKGQEIATEWLLKLTSFGAPDELFAQNVLLDDRTPPSLRNEIYNDHMYFIDWENETVHHPYNLHDVNQYWNNIEMSGAMFARKFMSPIDAKEMIDRIHSHLHSNHNHINRIIARMQAACNLSHPACVLSRSQFQSRTYTAF
uniref:protein xylosyltransferase n=1 Tax=Timspurckia oligopyrenoides TaxID=708627 RepID=A0A7S0ZJ01_9RHOD|mmetsp:Transcript_7134/g.12816  ORF Transcript_7134/g.12816 Transcript_7134/m.12816 type:complete len:359 (+) Transcript_7134:56-1132(+)